MYAIFSNAHASFLSRSPPVTTMGNEAFLSRYLAKAMPKFVGLMMGANLRLAVCGAVVCCRQSMTLAK